MKIKYFPVDLSQIIAYYAKEFKNVASYETFIDPVKKIVVFKLFIEGEDEN